MSNEPAIYKGELSSSTNVGMYIHTSNDPVNWSDGILVAAGADAQFPALIGELGHDVFTTEYNKLYFKTPPSAQDLWRAELQFIN